MVVILRIADVNLNRLTEALKVVEDICRFALPNDAGLRTVRRLRMEIVRRTQDWRRRAIAWRASGIDPGRPPDFDQQPRTGPDILLQANLKRAQEASRVLEEIAKLPTALSGLPAQKLSAFFKEVRFRCYDLEQTLLTGYERQRWCQTGSPVLYVVLDTQTVGRRHLHRLVEQLVQGGVAAIQLREPKGLPTREFLRDARQVQQALAGSRVKFIINDRVDVALAMNADGIHLGQDDLPLSVARQLLPANRIIGISVTSPAQARSAEQGGADYLGAGAVFPTASKPDADVIGLTQLRAICRATKLPVVAIGGITQANVARVLRTGVCGVAVISAVLGSGSIRSNLQRLRNGMTIQGRAADD